MKRGIISAALALSAGIANAASATAATGDAWLTVFDLTPSDSFEAGIEQTWPEYWRYYDTSDGPFVRDEPCRVALDVCFNSRTTGPNAFDHTGGAYVGGEYSVLPFTSVTVTVTAYVQASVDAPGEVATSTVGLGANWDWANSNPALGSGSFNDSLSATGVFGAPVEAQRTMSLTFANNTNQVAWFSFYQDLEYQVSTLAPVPEPSTYALMGIGLGVVLWQARRRSRAATAGQAPLAA